MADIKEPLNFKETKEAVLLLSYELVKWSICVSISGPEIKKWIGWPVSNVFLIRAMKEETSLGHFVWDRNSGEFTLTSSGIARAERLLVRSDLYREIAGFVSARKAPDISSEKIAPAADGFVSLDHNSEPYGQAVSSLDEVVKEFREDKTKDNELGQEKAALLRMLEAGRGYLNDTKVRVQTVISSIVEPLKIIAAKYEQALVGALAGTALNLVFALLGML